MRRRAEKARGATLYINLEPCSHQGRTGPCADAVIAAGIRRVVACMADPNPAVSGRGFARLRQAGVQVASGLLEEEARPLNDAFAKFIRYKLPLVTLKAGMTLDGKIAPPPEEMAGHCFLLGILQDIKRWARAGRRGDGLPAMRRGRMCSNCGMRMTQFWREWGR